MSPLATTFSLLAAFSLLATVLASPTVIKDSPITIPLIRHLNLTGTSIVKSDRARAHYLKTRHLGSKSVQAPAGQPVDVGITNTAVVYTAEVSIGTSGQTFNLIVDTGSANTWVGANPLKAYVPSGINLPTGLVSVTYGSGSFIGLEYTDQLSVGSLTIPAQSFGSALLSSGFQGVDGILGVGPTDLTTGTLLLGGAIPTVTDNAYSLGLIPAKVLGVYFQPTTSLSDPNGELTFGGTDSSKYTGSPNYVPITSTSPASNYVGIDQTVTYGSQTIITSSGIVDTGTTLILLATDALDQYLSAIGGAVKDGTTGLYKITTAQYNALQSLFFTIGGTTYEFTKNAQIWPRSLNTALQGDANGIYLIVNDLGSASGKGLDFINGLAFLQRFYTVYDSSSSRFGIATTDYTFATSN